MPAGKRRKAAQLFVAVFVFWVGTTGAERLISAQKSRTTRTSEGVERTYADSVRATFGSIQIDADSAIVRSDGEYYLFVRGVRRRDGERSIRADALTDVAADSVARFRGRVRITDTGRAIRASRVEYDLGRQVLRAEGDVRVRMMTSTYHKLRKALKKGMREMQWQRFVVGTQFSLWKFWFKIQWNTYCVNGKCIGFLLSGIM